MVLTISSSLHLHHQNVETILLMVPILGHTVCIDGIIFVFVIQVILVDEYLTSKLQC